MNELIFPNMRPSSIVGYLKAVGLLRVVTEQIDSGAHGYWDNENGFVLASRVPGPDLVSFLMHDYSPTPCLTPWNNGSGFYSKQEVVIDPLRSSTAQRLSNIRETIEASYSVLGDATRVDGTDAKEKLITHLRNVWPDVGLDWMDAIIPLINSGYTTPVLSVTGGNDGNWDYGRNFCLMLQLIMNPETGEPASQSHEWLLNAFADSTTKLVKSSFGPFDAESKHINPWDLLLVMEGICAFAWPANTKMSVREHDDPFVVQHNANANTSPDEKGTPEMWLPVWDMPMALVTLQSILFERIAEGRTGRYGDYVLKAKTSLDMARFTQGKRMHPSVNAYERFGLLVRNGQSRLFKHYGTFALRDSYRWYYRQETSISSDNKFYGLQEFAVALDWRKEKLSTNMRRGKVPEPFARLASGPIWTREQVDKFVCGQKHVESFGDNRHA